MQVPPQDDNERIEALIPHPPDTKVMDKAYMHNMLRQISYVNVLLKRLAMSYMTVASDALEFQQNKKNWNIQRQRLTFIRSCLDSRINEHLEPTIFGPRCQALCGQMYETLPREMRDAVYDCLFPPAKLAVTHTYLEVLQRDTEQTYFPPQFFDMIGGKPYAHVFKDVFAHTAVRIEMLEVWYCNTIFQFDANRYVDPVRFFDFDRCASYDLCRTITRIELVFPHATLQSSTRIWHDESDVARFKDRVLSSRKLKPGAYITLSLCALEDNEHSAGVKMFCALVDALKLVLEHGHKLCVLLKEGSKFEVTKEKLDNEYWSAKAATLTKP